MLTYADLEKAFRQERAAPTLQKLPPEFYAEARTLAAAPEAQAFSDSILEHLRKIHSLRTNKIIHYAGRAAPSDRPPDNILAQEAELYAQLMGAVAENRAKVLEAKIEAPPPAQEKKPSSKVRIRQALPAIAASDGRDYGPFKVDDIVELPQDLVELLVKRSVAEMENAP
jgi:DNA replication initiation complex subunit (GINS family)